MKYWPVPKTITRDYIDMNVAIDLDDPHVDTKYGVLVDVDKEGNLHIAMGNKKPKKFAPTDDVQLLVIQTEQGVRFLSPNLFEEEDLENLNDPEVQQKIHDKLQKSFKQIDTENVPREERIDQIMGNRENAKKKQQPKKKASTKERVSTRKKKVASQKKPASEKKASGKGTTVNGVPTVC